MHIRIATRKSQLAVWQAEHVASLLEGLDAVDSVELVRLSTRGDEILDRSLQKIGGKGLFTAELEAARDQHDYARFRKGLDGFTASLSERIGRWVQRYPEVEIVSIPSEGPVPEDLGAQVLLLEIGASRRLHGAPDRLSRRLLRDLSRLGYQARLLSDPREQKAEKQQERLLIQLIVAAAFGMQVMLLYLVQLYPMYARGEVATPAIRNLIREHKLAQMYSSVQTGQADGMQTMDQHLRQLVDRGLITSQTARGRAENKEDF